jgi:hypothetical protein
MDGYGSRKTAAAALEAQQRLRELGDGYGPVAHVVGGETVVV